MATIDQIIQQSFNPFGPFDSDSPAARNFWLDQDSSPTVESIHQQPLTQIKSVVAQIAKDHKTRTIILYGDAGSGKTHFMGRLKKSLSDQAFFAYIEPFSQSDHIWRHILRNTVDSLVNAPSGQIDSQLILWLKSCLSTIGQGLQREQQTLIDRIKGIFGQTTTDVGRDRQLFIDILKKTIGTTGIYNANEFFGVLYDLTNPELYFLACEWLKGDNLDEDSLKKLRVRQSIDDEDHARGILGNFSKISARTQPIVLCFDQLDSIARLPDGSIDIQALFNVTSTLYNGNWQGLLIILSIKTSTWNDNYKRIQPSDLDRASIRIPLKRITIEEAEALLATRLAPLHSQATPKPDSQIYPLTQQVLEKIFPGRKASPRQALELGKRLFQDYKEWLFRDKQLPKPKWLDIVTPPLPLPPPQDNTRAEFELLWLQEYKKSQEKITKITLLAATDLIRMLEQALAALQVQEIKPKLIGGRYTSYSLSYQQPGQGEKIGVVWTEDSNMTSFFNVMNACQKVIQQDICQTLYLIRAGGVGKPNLAGNQIYQQIFTYTNHRHIKPTLPSVHYLMTYHNLVKAVEANELVVAGKIINLKQLEALTRESQVLHKCALLQNLGIVTSQNNVKNIDDSNNDLQPVKQFLFNVVKTQSYMGISTLIQHGEKQFPVVQKSEIQKLIQQLCYEEKTQIIDPKAPIQDQLICLVKKN